VLPLITTVLALLRIASRRVQAFQNIGLRDNLHVFGAPGKCAFVEAVFIKAHKCLAVRDEPTLHDLNHPKPVLVAALWNWTFRVKQQNVPSLGM
jgi:hypothetical protein